MFDRTQWFLAGMSIALSVQLSQPVAAAVPVGKVVQTAQTNSSEAAQKAFQEGAQLYNQGTAQAKRSAITKFEEALKLFRAVGDRSGEANTLTWLGGIYSELGEQQKALEYYSQSLPLFRATGDRGGEATTLNNIGLVYSDLGEKQKALEYYSQSLPLRRAVGDRSGEAATLSNIGNVYSDLGEKQKALEYYSQSLPLRRATGDRRGEATTLSNIGAVYDGLGEKQKALEYYSQSLPLSQAVGDRSLEASILNNIGSVYNDLGEKQKALEYYRQSLPLSRAVGDRAKEATTLNNIGLVYSDLGEKQKALEYYSQSLPLSRAVGHRRGEALTLNNIGSVYSDLGEKQKALEYYSQSLPLSRATGDRGGEALTLTNIGNVYSDLGEKQKALEYYSQSLPLLRAVGARSLEAVTLIGIGGVYSDLGEKQKALEYYSQSLPLSRATGDRRGEARILNSIGQVYDDLGEKQKALEYYSQSLPLSRATGDRGREATTLNNIGVVYSKLGEKQKALEYYSQSLPLSRAVGDRIGEAGTLNNIGLVYSDLGEKQKALEYYSQSLPLSRAVSDRGREATTLNNIGLVYSDLGEKQKALEYYSQSLPLFRAVGDRSGEAMTLNNIGAVYSDLGEKQKALEYYSQSLPLFRAVGDRRGEAMILNNIGGVYSQLGEKQKAREYYSQSLPLSRAVGDRSGEAATLSGIAYAKRDQNNLTEALNDIESSLKIIENLRTKIASPELRSSYFATVQNYYEFYIDLLMQLHKTHPKSGYDTKALEASERSRARSLLELLFESNANIREGIDPDLLQQEKSLQQQLDAIEKQRIETISSPNPNQTKIAEIDKQRLALLEQYQQLQTKIRTASPRYAALTQPQPLKLPEIQKQILDENTILLQYSLGPDRSYLWVVTSTGLTSYELPKQVDIETAARNFRDAATSPIQRDIPQQVAEASANLGKLILQPAAAQLGNKRLLIIPDGVLHYTPFPALIISPIAGQNTNVPLIASHEIITLPSASSLAILRQNYGDRKPPGQTLAILADPVFSPEDERVKGQVTQATTEKLEANNLGLNRSLRASNRGWPPERLPFSRQEAQTISSLFPSASIRQKIDFDANRTTATDGSLANYQIVHFATHGMANSKNPELSGIVMSTVDNKGNLVNGFLRLTDIFNLKLAANLVVLSACQTGMGQNVKGEGMVGLTRGFMYAGAQRVAVSLWSVDDEGTAVLMQKFYQKMQEQKLAPAAALRAAQMEMMQQEKWKSPYYWAAFTLQGEWK
ncbi:tetratricopeptide repeat protein [Microcoleus sp. AT9b-C3]